MNYNTVSFPGLGIGEFTIDPVAIPIGKNITIEWYAIIICVGILAAFFVCERLAPRFELTADHLLDAILVGLPAGFVGARLWYILGDLKNFDSFMDVIAVWEGGLAIYGGIFGACIAAIFFCRAKKVSLLNMLDIVSIGFMIGQIIGRWGNFANVEVFGVQTDLPWRMGVGVDCIAEYVHPLFLYESLWNLLGLLLILGYMDFRKYRGEIFLLYTAWYGIGRAWMEPMRDAAYNLKIFGLRVNMVLAIVMAVLALAAFIILHLKKPARFALPKRKEKAKPEEKYQPQFDYAKEEDEEPLEENQEGEEENGEDH